jgi:hypothetical protein
LYTYNIDIIVYTGNECSNTGEFFYICDENEIRTDIIGVTIQTACGSGSTTLTPPSDIDDLYRIPNYPTFLTASSVFATSNPNCDVTSHTLTVGSAHFELVNQLLDDDEDGGTPLRTGFLIEMKEAASKVSEAYSYTV